LPVRLMVCCSSTMLDSSALMPSVIEESGII
jgi:hypothetical protein